jgi:hypothetical protein
MPLGLLELRAQLTEPGLSVVELVGLQAEGMLEFLVLLDYYVYLLLIFDYSLVEICQLLEFSFEVFVLTRKIPVGGLEF